MPSATYLKNLGVVVGCSLIVLQLSFFVPEHIFNMMEFGRSLWKEDLSLDYVIALIWALALSFLVPFFVQRPNERYALLMLWIAKCVVTLFFALYYERFYPHFDARSFFINGLNLEEPLQQFRFGLGTTNVVALVSLLNEKLPVFGSYHGLKVIFSFFGFLGVWFTYLGICKLLERRNIVWLLAVGFFPSILFWSSILGKDPIQYFGIALCFYGFASWLKNDRSLRALLSIALGLIISMSIRIWAGPILIAPFLLALLWQTLVQKKFSFASLGLLTISLIAALLAFDATRQRFKVEALSEVVEATNDVSRGWQHGGSAQQVPEFHGYADMLSFAPKGMIAALFRPLPGEINNPFGLLAGLENLLILILFMLGTWKMLQSFNQANIKIWLYGTILFWALVYGFISYQNLGSAARFRLQILPFVIGFLIVFYLERFSRNTKPV